MLEDATRRRIPLPGRGVAIALLDWGGDGPLALLHHANGFCAALFAPVARALRGRFRVVAMDARGHGDSDEPTGEDAYAWSRFGEDARAVARALLAERGEDRAGLALGHSFGGTSLMYAASIDPSLFSALVMLDPVLHPPIEAAARPRAGASELADRARRRRPVFESREAARAAWSDKPLFADWTREAFDTYLAEGLAERADGQVELKCPSRVEAAIFGSGPDYDPWAVAEQVTTRALLVRAERSTFSRAVYEGIAARMADARVLEVPTGHLMVMEAPERVVDVVSGFVGGAAGAQRSTG